MGKKYIIEINDKYKQVVLLSAEGELYCKDVAGLMPYTEPDLEHVRKEAYDKGFEDGKELCPIPEVCHDNAYQKGLSDAWDAARKINCLPSSGGIENYVLGKIFGYTSNPMIMEKFFASECIEKIRAYEQEKEELGIQGYFKKGEEVIDADGTKAVILRVSEDNYCQVYTEKGCIENWHIHTYKFHKTGRCFTEIAEVLEKMRGEQDGKRREE